MPRVKQTARGMNGQAPGKSGRVKQVAAKAKAGFATGGVKKPTTLAEKKEKDALAQRNAKHRSLAYRKMARQAGYFDDRHDNTMSVDGAGGRDALLCLLSPHDVKRLIFYNPQTGSDAEKARREKLLGVLAPPKALRHAQVRVDAMLRNIMNEAVLRSVELGKLRVSAHFVHAAIRPYIGKGLFSQGQLPPGNVVETMVNNGALKPIKNDAQVAQADDDAGEAEDAATA